MPKTWRSTVLETVTWHPCPLTITTTKLYLPFKLEFRFQSHSSKVSASQRSAPCSLQESYSLTQVHICHLIILDYMTSSFFFFKYKLNWFPLGQGQPLVLLGNQLVCEGMQTVDLDLWARIPWGVPKQPFKLWLQKGTRVGQVPCAALTALEVT